MDKSLVLVVWVVGTIVMILIAGVMAAHISQLERGAISHGCAYYDEKLDFKWREK